MTAISDLEMHTLYVNHKGDEGARAVVASMSLPPSLSVFLWGNALSATYQAELQSSWKGQRYTL